MRHRPIPLENKALVRRMFEEDNKRNLAAVEEIIAPDYVIHGLQALGLPPTFTPGLEGWRQMRIAIWTAFPDLHYTLEDLIAEGDKVVCRYTFRGTHRGEFMGAPPTGKQVSMAVIEIDRIGDDKLVETWANVDALGLMQQLGAIPQMAQGGA